MTNDAELKALVLELSVTPGGVVQYDDLTVAVSEELDSFECREAGMLILTTPHASVAAKFLAGVLS